MFRIIHKILFEKHHIFLILEKLQGVILYANLDKIFVSRILKPLIHSYIMKFTVI